MPLLARTAAALALLGVVLGAFGAHGLKETLNAAPAGMETWKTAVFYHLVHAVVMYFLAATGSSRRAWCLFAGGILLFSGSLYLLAALQWKWLGPVTPIGGVLFIAGWATLVIRRPLQT
jgi:uncharacterized membrane protein YgdD (TMEM256/DUF423 family)